MSITSSFKIIDDLNKNKYNNVNEKIKLPEKKISNKLKTTLTKKKSIENFMKFQWPWIL